MNEDAKERLFYDAMKKLDSYPTLKRYQIVDVLEILISAAEKCGIERARKAVDNMPRSEYAMFDSSYRRRVFDAIDALTEAPEKERGE